MKVLKYPAKIYQAIVFYIKKQRKRDWILEERNVLITNLLETLKTYVNLFLSDIIIGKIVGKDTLYI